MRVTTLLFLCVAAPASAVIIPITNPSFDDLNVTLRPGEMTSGMGTVANPTVTHWPFPFSPGLNSPQSGVIVPGWRSLTPNTLVGVLNPTYDVSGTPWMTGYSGPHVAAIQAAVIGQVLDALIQPSTVYTLRFRAGIGLTDSTYFANAVLIASPNAQTHWRPGAPGVETLRFSQSFIPSNQHGIMHDFVMSYTTPAVLPPNLAGLFIGVGAYGSDGIPRVLYDDFELDATPVPAPATLPLLALIFAFRRRR